MDQNKRRIPYFVVPIITGLGFWLAWPPQSLFFLLFVVFVPLLMLAEIKEKTKRYFFSCYLAFLIWHVSVTFWLYYATVIGALLVHLLSPLILTIPCLLFKWIKDRQGKTIGYICLCLFWISIEYLHTNWTLAFPFLHLGNGLSKYPVLVQWYEYTGVLGGSLWILIINILSYELILQSSKYGWWTRYSLKSYAYLLFVLILPTTVSFVMYHYHREKGYEVKVLALHPNTNCHNEKYTWSIDKLAQHYTSTILLDDNTDIDYIIWPETALPSLSWIETVNKSKVVQYVRKMMQRYPEANLVTGAVLYKVAPNQALYANYSKDNNWFYSYNSAIQISSQNERVFFRAKEKLVPVEEYIPYPTVFEPIRKVVKSLGGFKFSPYSGNNVFSEGAANVLPLICYESVFGEATAKHVREGANIIFILLNEGWYRNITGASQFMHYASLRAIENRRSIARSSNEGVTCFINQKGEITKQLSAFAPATISAALKANKKKTFYTLYGDYIGRIALGLSGIIIFYLLLFKLKKQ